MGSYVDMRRFEHTFQEIHEIAGFRTLQGNNGHNKELLEYLVSYVTS